MSSPGFLYLLRTFISWGPLLALTLCCSPCLGQQDTFDIIRVIPNEATKTIDIELKAIVDGKKLDTKVLNATNIEIKEYLTGSSSPATSLTNNISLIYPGASLDSKADIVIRINPPEDHAIYRGEARRMEVIWTNHPPASAAFTFGSPSNPINFASVDWLSNAIIGMLIVSGFLALMSQLIPFMNRRSFRKRFVKPYKDIESQNIRKLDPLTGKYIEPDDLVVTKCRTVVTLATWEYNNFQCPNYPDCRHENPPCMDGEPSQENEHFFSQQGPFRKLNWLWFGALGGLIAWGMWAGLQALDWSGFRQAMGALAGLAGLEMLDYSLTKEVYLGFSLGFGIIFTLAWVEERGQSAKFSWGRIIVRALIGALVSAVVFMLGFFLYRSLVRIDWLGGLITWILFGTALGWSLSLRSTLTAKRAILGGLAASVAGYILFLGISGLFDAFELAKMLAFIAIGAVLGLIVDSVVTTLENIELEYLEPAKFSRVNPISKWLFQGINIMIGSDSGCRVFVKWTDPAVEPQHAELSYTKGKVFLTPKAEVLINGRRIPEEKAYPLQDDDIIQLGRHSISKMRYHERTQTP
ncbi:MAG: FHA domain-containing protein [Bacteroidota bacterium]